MPLYTGAFFLAEISTYEINTCMKISEALNGLTGLNNNGGEMPRVVKSKKIVVKSKENVVKSKKIVINKLKQISIDPLDNGEELPIIVCEIDGESERYLLGKTNILYSLDTPAKLIGKLNITDKTNKLGNIYICSS